MCEFFQKLLIIFLLKVLPKNNLLGRALPLLLLCQDSAILSPKVAYFIRGLRFPEGIGKATEGGLHDLYNQLIKKR